MSLSPQFLDELRARTSLSALVQRTVKLQKAGREWKACCPFHKEKTPSFTLSDEKGFYHCFGCGAHGDAIRWLTDARGLPFMEAVKELADAAGMEVPAADPRAQEKAARAVGLYDVMEAAQAWFVDQLAGIEGSEARAYLAGRGIGEKTIRKFGFGFAPDSRGRLKAALARFGNDKLVETGLLIAPEGGEREPYDRFRGRLMIPIRDQRGRVIAFGGRILGSGEPKYLNSPETPLFDKGRTLYNLDLAGPASRDSRRLIVVEGYMDVIALDQAGIGEGVAPLGTGGWSPPQSSASTAMPPARRLPSEARFGPCPMSARADRSASSPCRSARIRTISCAAAAVPRSRPCSRRLSLLSIASGAMKPRPSRSTRPSERRG